MLSVTIELIESENLLLIGFVPKLFCFVKSEAMFLSRLNFRPNFDLAVMRNSRKPVLVDFFSANKQYLAKLLILYLRGSSHGL